MFAPTLLPIHHTPLILADLRRHGSAPRNLPCCSSSHSPSAVTAASSLRAFKNPPRSPRPDNVPGEFFVDHTCIDCDTCRWMAPGTFTRVGEMSAVYNQPVCPNERLAALQALLSCPTASIHSKTPSKDIFQAYATFPIPIDEKSAPGIYHCGYHSRKSYGATSYLITKPEGNILVDSPKYTEHLVHRIEDMGGVRYMFLSHMDDVADHNIWKERFHCERIIHREDVRANTSDVEVQLEGTGPWRLGEDIDLIYTPGHTKGCISLLHKPTKALFTGDHLANSQDGTGLSILRNYNCHSVELQIESVQTLVPLDFIWILPGHGRRIMFKDVQEKNAALLELLKREKT
eukprot:c20215_g1_i1 orf=182-1219(+)